MSNDKELVQTQYDDIVVQHQAAYTAYKKVYESKNPPPVREKAKAENRGMVAALVVLVTASVIVSGSRTVNEFGGGLVGMSAFVMLELGIITYAYIRTRVDYDEKRFKSVKALLGRGMWLAFAVAVAANLHATLKDQIKIEALNVAILVLVAISAPVLAFISGDVAGMLSAVDYSHRRKADMKYAETVKEYLHGLNASWAREKGKWGVKFDLSETVQVSSNGQSNGQYERLSLPSVSTIGHRKQPNASAIVRQYLNQYPEAVGMDSRQLGELLGVGKSTVNNVQREYKSGQRFDDDNEDTKPSEV